MDRSPYLDLPVRTEAEAFSDIVLNKARQGSLSGDFNSNVERMAEDDDYLTLEAMERLTKDYQGRMEKLCDRLHRKQDDIVETIHGYLTDMRGDTFGSLRKDMATRDLERGDH